MANKALINYIKSELAKGFDINTVKQHLIEHGYSDKIIDDTIHHLYSKHVVSKTTLLVVVSVILSVVLISGFVFVYFSGAGEKTLLDVSVDLSNKNLMAGEDLEFNVELTNLGSSKRYDVTVRYFIKDPNNKVVNSEEETIAIETSVSKILKIKIPENSVEGSYTLHVIARYDDKEARASSSFNVNKEVEIEEPIIGEEPEEANCFDNIQNGDETGIDCGGSCMPCVECPASCDDGNECTEDYCSYETDYECNHDFIDNCCGNNICEDGESSENCEKDCGDMFHGLTMYDRIEKIKQIAESDPNEAGDYCKEIKQITYKDLCFVGLAEVVKSISVCDHVEEERAKDECYSVIAEVTNDSRICEKISTENRRDSCYLTFVMNKDYSVCNKIVNEYLRNSCNTLKEVQEQQ